MLRLCGMTALIWPELEYDRGSGCPPNSNAAAGVGGQGQLADEAHSGAFEPTHSSQRASAIIGDGEGLKQGLASTGERRQGDGGLGKLQRWRRLRYDHSYGGRSVSGGVLGTDAVTGRATGTVIVAANLEEIITVPL